ncbi:MAG: hypothetical protein KatS3mg096_807 [Candidatus Parcubacteria bacterium]|nr:MAG: hypothetical protein KatS3mg096_807 [Candidatus Parcubacteria bacterium]
MEWIPLREVIRMFADAGFTNINISYVISKFKDKIKTKRIGLKRKLYDKQSVAKLIQELLNE